MIIKAILILLGLTLCIVGMLASSIAMVVLGIRRRARMAALSGFLALSFAMAGVAFGVVFLTKSFRAVERRVVELGEGRSGTNLFLATVMDQIPASLEILHSQDDPIPLGFDPAYWLHFRISADDFPLVLKHYPYEKLSDWTADRLEAMHPPKWWQLDSLGADTEAYRCDRYRPGDSSKVPSASAVLWVNREHSEVYFCLVYY